MKDKRKAYEEKLDAQLEEWNAQIAMLKAKADKGKADFAVFKEDYRHALRIEGENTSFSLQDKVKQ